MLCKEDPRFCGRSASNQVIESSAAAKRISTVVRALRGVLSTSNGASPAEKVFIMLYVREMAFAKSTWM